MTLRCVDRRTRLVKDLQLAFGICYSRSRSVVTPVGIDSFPVSTPQLCLDRFEHCFHIYWRATCIVSQDFISTLADFVSV